MNRRYFLRNALTAALTAYSITSFGASGWKPAPHALRHRFQGVSAADILVSDFGTHRIYAPRFHRDHHGAVTLFLDRRRNQIWCQYPT